MVLHTAVKGRSGYDRFADASGNDISAEPERHAPKNLPQNVPAYATRPAKTPGERIEKRRERRLGHDEPRRHAVPSRVSRPGSSTHSHADGESARNSAHSG